MQVDVLNSKGEKTGRAVELPDDIFNIEPNDHVIYLAVKQYNAAQRAGTHKTKTRAEVKGSSKKLHRQKGTGGSRKGNIRNPLYKGGGTVNGPLPHKYNLKLNRKVKDLAKMSALSYKAKENKIVVVEDLNLEAPKTKTFADMMQVLTPEARRTMFILPEYNANAYLSARNLPNNKTVVLSDMNTYDLMNASMIVFTENAAKMFSEEEAIVEEA
jgi:large subunit ribosomal protein L4